MHQLCRVGERCINVVHSQGGIAGQDLVLGSPLGKTIKYHCDWNPSPRRTEVATADLWATAKERLPRRHGPVYVGRRPCADSVRAVSLWSEACVIC
jgi:hypothetical protein